MSGDADDAPLREWLRDAARVHERFLGKTLQALEAAGVADVDDLLHLEGLPEFDRCLAPVTASKIRMALARRAAGDAVAAAIRKEVATNPFAALSDDVLVLLVQQHLATDEWLPFSLVCRATRCAVSL